MAELRCDITHSFSDFQLDLDLNLDVDRLGVFGPSGCGKTTLLETLTGLLEPDSGTVVFGNETWVDTNRGILRPPEQRQVGYLMQDTPLLPHKTVAENINYGATAGSDRKADSLYEMLDITNLHTRYPETLSGGERRRVALAQALNSDPSLLLLDEPLVGLSESRRSELLPAIRRVTDQLSVPVIVVSHRPVIMRSLTDRIIPMINGHSRGEYTVTEFFQNDDIRTEGLLDDTNLYEANITSSPDSEGLLSARTSAGLEFQLLGDGEWEHGDRVVVSFSAREPILGTGDPTSLSPRNHWRGRVEGIERNHQSHLITLSIDGETLWARVTEQTVRSLGIEPGQKLDVLMKSHSLDVQPL